jgi:hypothetical protein
LNLHLNNGINVLGIEEGVNMERNGSNGQTLQGKEIDAATIALEVVGQEELIRPLTDHIFTVEQAIYGTGARTWAEGVVKGFGLDPGELTDLVIHVDYRRKDGTEAGDIDRVSDELPMSEFETIIVRRALERAANSCRESVGDSDLAVIDSLVQEFEDEKISAS